MSRAEQAYLWGWTGLIIYSILAIIMALDFLSKSHSCPLWHSPYIWKLLATTVMTPSQGFLFWPWVSTRPRLGPARVRLTGSGGDQSGSDGWGSALLGCRDDSECLVLRVSRNDPVGETPVVHCGNIFDDMLLMGTFSFPTPNWCFLESGPTRTIPKLLSWFSFWENSNWDNKIGMEKQWQCLLEVAWRIF